MQEATTFLPFDSPYVQGAVQNTITRIFAIYGRHRWARWGYEREDLLQMCFVWYEEAKEKFDASRGGKEIKKKLTASHRFVIFFKRFLLSRLTDAARTMNRRDDLVPLSENAEGIQKKQSRKQFENTYTLGKDAEAVLQVILLAPTELFKEGVTQKAYLSALVSMLSEAGWAANRIKKSLYELGAEVLKMKRPE